MNEFLITLITVFIVDLPYLIPFSPFTMYMIKDIQKEPLDFRYIPLGLVYPLMALAIRVLVHPHLQKGNIFNPSVKYGGTLGLAMYGVYELMNLGMLKRWRPLFTIIELFWGFLSNVLASAISFYFLTKFPRMIPKASSISNIANPEQKMTK